jgi:hypothetical protein
VVMGVEQHLLRLGEVGAQEKGACGTA